VAALRWPPATFEQAFSLRVLLARYTKRVLGRKKDRLASRSHNAMGSFNGLSADT